jgi:hypothetical protein
LSKKEKREGSRFVSHLEETDAFHAFGGVLDAVFVFAIFFAILAEDLFAELARNERANLVFVVARLHDFLIDDDGTFENRGIVDDEVGEFPEAHFFGVQIVVFENLRTRRDDVLKAVFREFQHIDDVVAGQFDPDDVFFLVWDFVFFEPFLGFAARRAARTGIERNHRMASLS